MGDVVWRWELCRYEDWGGVVYAPRDDDDDEDGDAMSSFLLMEYPEMDAVEGTLPNTNYLCISKLRNSI